MLKGKFKIGDYLWTYDYHYDAFIRVKVDSCKVVNNQIMYNGMYAQEDCFYTLKNSYLHECDYQTKLYKDKLKELASQYASTQNEVQNNVEEDV